MSITVLCPTRGRPDSAWESLRHVQATATLPDTRIIFLIEEDQIEAYSVPRADQQLTTVCVPGGKPGMVKALNDGAAQMLSLHAPPAILGFVGDDHRFRTKGWDQVFATHARTVGPCMMYGNDKHRSDIPTQIFITSDIIRALGWMSPPDLHHLYVDNSWKELGDAADVLYYFKDVVIEHLHPFYQTAKMDEGYARVNDQKWYDRDQDLYTKWRLGSRFTEDVAKVGRVVEAWR